MISNNLVQIYMGNIRICKHIFKNLLTPGGVAPRTPHQGALPPWTPRWGALPPRPPLGGLRPPLGGLWPPRHRLWRCCQPPPPWGALPPRPPPPPVNRPEGGGGQENRSRACLLMSVRMVAFLSPAQRRARAKERRKRTSRQWRWMKTPWWNRHHCIFPRSHSAHLFPFAFPCNTHTFDP